VQRQAWTDERLDDLAATLRPLPAQVARNTEAIERLTDDVREIRDEIRSMRAQFTQIGWALVGTLFTALVALIVAVA
jgi:nitrogen fixation/metabolism regulation signal transduction histidine kinase